ncbi:2-amino-4-hydroxy-6-hydroxymethyldihydropteridinediphosphokinase [Algoriphagus ornithinivorans]|uniref:2-amino-4-hydroxy-6-hydroxymethyldihydropteridine pyrophosphokinase n=1 Tax=Algoriphagus ornithinivorans TaxID=226506 RepID=A0A1I5AAL6_9BACT|nr:2-amino-4-hydroxy-6-hydroxymethyldihydropteridine diphosphokinase [Algoriphagus ornithinivorans]SFN59641.1 2-amino-4-hydroxy-6-hydroxymethyldihydropteridinediphosphokinase [Algoriphagus ornithinivorans]
MNNEVVLILGGNLGDTLTLIEEAKKLLLNLGELKGKSSIYRTEAWGNVADQDFLNQVVVISTDLEPLEFLKEIQGIEKVLGRKRVETWGNRTMDIDILYWNQEVIDHENLKVPHPYLQRRKFVLIPLVEILPDQIHPILNQTNSQILEVCPDESLVEILEP